MIWTGDQNVLNRIEQGRGNAQCGCVCVREGLHLLPSFCDLQWMLLRFPLEIANGQF